jgi:hypothetical protein
VWNHPLDLHFYTSSLAGWPQLVFEVGSLDFYGGKHLRQEQKQQSEVTRIRVNCHWLTVPSLTLAGL